MKIVILMGSPSMTRSSRYPEDAYRLGRSL